MLLKAHSRNIINLYADGAQSRINEIRPVTGAPLTTQVYSLKRLYDAYQVVSFLGTQKSFQTLSNAVICMLLLPIQYIRVCNSTTFTHSLK